MLTISDNAREELDTFFKDREKNPIRVYLAPGGCSGPRLSLALDSPGDEDTVFEDKGYTFCINNELYAAAKNVAIGFSDMGFSVDSELQIGNAGGCSPSCCSGCGGGCSQ